MSRGQPDIKTLRREHELQQNQIAYETEQREQMLRVLNQEKSIPAVPQEHLLALDRRVEEEARLRAEVTEMKRFLMKGVSEAKRLAQLAETLKSTRQELQSTSVDLSEDLARLTDTKRALEIEIETTKGTAMQQVDLRSELERNVSNLAIGAQETIKDVESARKDASHLRMQLEEIQVALRRLEKVDQGADNLSAATRRAHHNLEKLLKNVQTGSTSAVAAVPAARAIVIDESETERSDFDSEDDAEPSANAQVVSNAAKITISKSESVLTTLHSTLSRFESDEKQRLLYSRHQRAELFDQMKAEVEDLKLRSDHHLQVLRQELLHREPLLARYTEIRSQAMNHYLEKVEKSLATTEKQQPGNRSPTKEQQQQQPVHTQQNFSLIAYLDHENAELEAERTALEERQARLADKCQTRSVDYEAVRSLRHAYRDLETKKTLLAIDLRTAEEENKNLKSTLWISGKTPISVSEGPMVYKASSRPAAAGGKSPWKSTVQN
jgi:5-bromo-4-chloroindolyl phosphate hydrolysis protein